MAPEVIAVYCDEPGIKERTEHFLKESLKLESFQAIPAPGDFSGFLLKLFFPKDFNSLRAKVDDLVGKNPDVKRIILVSHDGWALFEKVLGLLKKLLVSSGIIEGQEELSQIVAAVSEKLNRGVKVDVYNARFGADGKPSFEKLA